MVKLYDRLGHMSDREAYAMTGVTHGDLDELSFICWKASRRS